MPWVAFEKDGVYLHTSAKRHPDQDSLIPGIIRIIEKDSGNNQPEEELFDPGYEPDWAVISTVGTRPRVQEETNAASGPKSPVPRGQWAFSLSLSELKSIRKSKPGLGWSYLIFITKDGISIQALHFHRGGTKALLKALCRYVILATSPKDSASTWFTRTTPTPSPIPAMSFSSLTTALQTWYRGFCRILMLPPLVDSPKSPISSGGLCTRRMGSASTPMGTPQLATSKMRQALK
ncbi:hypothetical protein JRQ81_005707 [Phrynocephalus forsythii]|uniref:Small G protein signalling modulator 1/2 Rab-binding domain-containing protein n=1 Tax=Phrynocephalus forsythii TaxID=171643 RepID=A0A9Q0XHC0_9SAUR|nr:hypothetical protein JRQ81_005707 [Phrynocephalus forsythii]